MEQYCVLQTAVTWRRCVSTYGVRTMEELWEAMDRAYRLAPAGHKIGYKLTVFDGQKYIGIIREKRE